MSNRKKKAVFVASSRKRPRHFQQGPDEAEEEQREEAAAAAQPPAARLYKHALESIFGFLSLKELSAVLAVSPSWSAAVGSMRGIDATVCGGHDAPSDSLLKFCASRLARHIGTVAFASTTLSQESINLAAQRMSGLHSLYFTLPSPLVGPLMFPPSVTELRLPVTAAMSARDINAVILAAADPPRLVALDLDFDGLDPLVSFAPLRRAAQLRTLEMRFRWSSLSPRQACELRALPSLTHLYMELQASLLPFLLRAPHQLPWEKLLIGGPLDGESAGLLASLPALTDLTVLRAADLNFVNSLPNLRTLGLSNVAPTQPMPSPEQLIAGVGLCSQLTELTLCYCRVTAAHVGALLSRMPAVTNLKLVFLAQLESLSFLSSEPLCSTLTSLELSYCRHPQLRTRELRHLYSLQRLTDLVIEDCFSERVDSFTISEFEPPSRHLPKLIRSSIKCKKPHAYAEEEEEEEED